MKKKNKKNRVSIPIRKEDLVSTSLEDVIKESMKEPGFRRGYNEAMDRIRLAKQLYDIRKLKRMTQKTVAQRTGMPQSVIARIESGKHGMSIETLTKMAVALGKQVTLVDITK